MDEIIELLIEELRRLVSYRAQPIQLAKCTILFSILLGLKIVVEPDATDKKIVSQFAGRRLVKALKAELEGIEQPFRFFKSAKLASPEKLAEAFKILFGYEYGWESADRRRYRVMELLEHPIDVGTWRKVGGPECELLEHLAIHLIESRDEDSDVA